MFVQSLLFQLVVGSRADFIVRRPLFAPRVPRNLQRLDALPRMAPEAAGMRPERWTLRRLPLLRTRPMAALRDTGLQTKSRPSLISGIPDGLSPLPRDLYMWSAIAEVLRLRCMVTAFWSPFFICTLTKFVYRAFVIEFNLLFFQYWDLSGVCGGIGRRWTRSMSFGARADTLLVCRTVSVDRSVLGGKRGFSRPLIKKKMV